jgi:peroxiredoxin
MNIYMRQFSFAGILAVAVVCAFAIAAAPLRAAAHGPHQPDVYDMGPLQPVATVPLLHKGDAAPDFELPATDGTKVRLSSFRGSKNVVISFVPAAFTPVCSDQWPGYNIASELFHRHDAVLLGISADNTPSQHAWIQQMGGLWFPVLSDFWPHGATAAAYGVLRPEGVSERAIFVVDKQGRIAAAIISDINKRPDLGLIIDALKDLP